MRARKWNQECTFLKAIKTAAEWKFGLCFFYILHHAFKLLLLSELVDRFFGAGV